MATTPALSTSATEAQAVAWLNTAYGSYKYANSQSTPYNGMTAAQAYAYLATQNPGASPYTIAMNASELMLSSAVGGAIGTGADEGTTVIGDAAQAAANGANYPSVSNPLDFLGSIANFFGDFTQATTWIRVAKVVVGAVLIVVGAAQLTGTTRVIKSAASKIPVVPA